MRITIDIHEPNEYVSLMRELGYPVEKRHLESGDIVIDHDLFYVGIEVKRKQDFDNSLHSGRLHEQCCRLYDNYSYPILIVEEWEGRGDVAAHLEAMETINLRIATFPMRDTMETVRFIGKICDLMVKHKLNVLRRPVLIEDSIDPQVQLLAGLPNVGKARAQEILDKYGTPAVAFAHIGEWEDFNGITTSRLERLIKIWQVK